jgi:uncharacterized protein with GYD domain
MPKFIFLIKVTDWQALQPEISGAEHEIPFTIRKDAERWQACGGKDIEFRVVTGEYDLIALAEGGTAETALKYALYLGQTGYYEPKTLVSFSLRELAKAVTELDSDTKKRG